MVLPSLNITSASGIISLLDETQSELKIFALKKLNEVVNEFWPEISEAIDKIEVLYEEKKLPERDCKLAALLASKIYYHLGSFEDSLRNALEAQELFDVNGNSEYIETTISKCIDQYTRLRVAQASGDEQIPIDPRLEAIVNRMFQRCFDDGQFRQAVGIALETRRMDIFEAAIKKSDDVVGMLAYTLRIANTLIQNRSFRDQVLRHLVTMYRGLTQPDYVNMIQCLISLDDAEAVGDVLVNLVKSGHEATLMAYQISFDLYESATQQFLARVVTSLDAVVPLAPVEGAPSSPSASSDAAPPPKTTPAISDELRNNVKKLVSILNGGPTIDFQMQFLIRANHADLLILKQTKDAVRNTICHTATIIANAIMHCGTTSDKFLRDNLDWLGKATNWAKFTATASLGVIHKGHEKEAINLMAGYLPRESGQNPGYTEGGGLYALGLIHAHHGHASPIIDYLLNQLKGASNEVIRHGGCLGLGLAAMSTHRQDVYDQLKANLYQDDAVTGEAAGIAMGLVMCGSKNEGAIEDMLSYAQETQHEKILRGLAVGLSLTMFGRMEQADTLIDTLCRDKDALLRRSGMHTIAMAYCGSGNNAAIRRLLHVAVSDVNDDVRRAAVEALGFLLFRTPEQCPSVVSLLSESYNPHVRYGSAIALGVSCAGTGNKEALALLEPMTNDPVNYVRQGALVASALILVQQTEQLCPKVKDFRTLYQKVIADKHDDNMAKFGAILAQGIIDAGGRNTTVALQSRTGHVNVPAAVGMLVFTQFWYWFPLSHFLALALQPTCIIGLNNQLNMPKLEFISQAKSSLFAYPPPLEEKKEEKKEKVTTAVLSITAKAQAKKREQEKEKHDKEPQPMEVVQEEEKKDAKEVEKKEAEKKDVEKKDAVKEGEKKDVKEGEKKDVAKDGEKKEGEKKDTEPAFEILSNPARVLKQQLKVMQMNDSSRYRAIKDVTIGGIIMMIDTRSQETEELVEPVSAGGVHTDNDQEEEPAPPEPFEYDE